MTKRLALAYRLPPEPSAPRVAVWRALQRLDGGYLLDGLYVVAATRLNEETLANLAHDVRNFGGEASVLRIESSDDEKHLESRLAAEPAPKRAPRRS